MTPEFACTGPGINRNESCGAPVKDDGEMCAECRTDRAECDKLDEDEWIERNEGRTSNRLIAARAMAGGR